jgi:ankyrin repeat protein
VRVISWAIYYGHHQILRYIVQQTKQNNEISELFGITEITHQSKSVTYTNKTLDSENSTHVGQTKYGIFKWIKSKIANTFGRETNVEKSGTYTSTNNEHKGNYNRSREEARLLLFASYSGDVHTIRVLLRYVCKESINKCIYDTPLTAACEGEHVGVVKELLKAGADVNLKGRWGDTPLIAACKGGRCAIVVKKLVKAGANVNLKGRWGNTPLIAAVSESSLSTVKCLVEHGADLGTQNANSNVSAVYRALILNKRDVVEYLILEQNKTNPDKFAGNVHLFNCLVDMRHAGVKTDSRDDVVVTERPVWYVDSDRDVWRTINVRDCDVLRHLLCVGLDVNLSIQVNYDGGKSYVRPLLFSLIDVPFVTHRTEKVRILLEAGADVKFRMRYSKYDSVRYETSGSVLDMEDVSVLERPRRLVCGYGDSKYVIPWAKFIVPEYTRVMSEIKKHIRRRSI